MTDSLRIAFVSMHTSPADLPGSGDAGGMNVVEYHQAFALARLGHRVDLITRRSDPGQADVTHLSDAVRLLYLPAGPPSKLAKSLIDAHVEEFSTGLAGLPAGDDRGGAPYDVVHSHHWMSGVAALPVARVWGVAHVQSFHSVAALPGSSLSDGEPPESPARVPGERLVASESDGVIAISAAEARTVVERCGADPDRVVIVPPGVDRSLFHADSAADSGPAPSANPRGYLLYAARLQPLKGPDLAIRALTEVPAELRPDLLIAGDVSVDFAAYEADLHALVDAHRLTGSVRFIGPQPRPQLARLMRGARIVLVPSHSETFGLIALEAESCGTPVVASAAGGLREAVVHGETGQLMDSRQPEDWGTAITRLLAKPWLLERMGVVAQIHARRFNWDWTARLLESQYRQWRCDRGV